MDHIFLLTQSELLTPEQITDAADYEYFEHRWSNPYAEYLRREFGQLEYVAELERRKSQFEAQQDWSQRMQLKKLRQQEIDRTCGFLKRTFRKVRRAVKEAYTCPPHLS